MEPQNPFIIIGEIPDAYFCDRVEETKTLCQLVTGGANVCLSAPRRLGKSKLIWHCFRQPQLQNYHTIYVDLYHTKSLNGFIKALGKATWGIDWSTMNSVEPALEDIFAALEKADKPCIVALDEFQQVADYPEANVVALLRGYIQDLRNCHFIFSGSKRHLLSRIFISPDSPFYQSTEPMPLHPIALDKYEQFAQQWMAHFHKSIEDGVVASIYEQAEGNTAFLQRTMHYAFDMLSPGECMTHDITRMAIQRMLDAADEFYKEQLSHLTDRQQDLLFAIANEGKAEKVLSGAFVKKYNLQSSSAVQTALKKLLEDSWVSEENGQYFIPDTIFRKYIDNQKQ